MAWIGLIVGVVLGAAIGKFSGALALGFIGWLVGFIIAAATKPKDIAPVQRAGQRVVGGDEPRITFSIKYAHR